MLRQHVERAGAQRRRVLRVLGDGVDGGAAFQHLEAVGRHQHGLRRLIEPVIGAADALQQPRAALGRADIDDQIDIAPVDAEIERRRAHHRAQFSGHHGVLDLAALGDVERAVMQRDGEIVVVDPPQFLEKKFGLAAGVDEDQRGLVRLDQRVDFAERVARRMTGPGQMLARCRACVTLGCAPACAITQIGARRAAERLRHQKAAEIVRFGDGRRQADGGELRRQREQPRQAERQKIAALGRDQRMQFVEHHALERAEQIRRVGAMASSSASCSGVVSRMSGG